MPCVDAIEESEAGGSVAAPGTSQMLPCDPLPLVRLKKELDDEQFPASHHAPCSNSGCVSDVLLPSNSLKSHEVNRETGSDSGHGSPTQHSPASRSTDEEPAATPAGNSCLPASVKAEVDFDDFKSDNDSECELSSDQEDSSCGGNLHADDELPFEDDFGELTSLAWLRDTNLLRNLATTAGDRAQRKHQKQALGGEKSAASVPAVADFKSSSRGGVGYSVLSQSPHTTAGAASQQPAGWFRGSRKPPYSFSCLIFMAIEQSPNRCLPVNAIYDWISRNFPYYQTAPTGWKNSVRHNLSLNKCFRKLDRESHMKETNGKGACWCVDPLYRPNLVQALQRTPYYGNQHLQLLSLTGNVSRTTAGPTAGAASSTIRYGAQVLPLGVDIEAANALVSLRMPSIKRELSPGFVSHKDGGNPSPSGSCHDFSSAPALKRQQCCDNEVDFVDVRSLPPDVVTDAPSADHTYTAAPPSTAERRSTAQQQSLLTSSSSSEALRLAAENELVLRDGVPSCDDGSDAASSASHGEEQELCNKTVLTAITSPAGTVSQNPASDRCLRGKMALQAFARATAICSAGRSNRWASSRLKSAAAAAGSPAKGSGCSGSSSLLRLASAASLAMMDDKLTRSGPSSR